MTIAPISSTIAEAIEEIRVTCAESTVTAEGDGAGGAWVIIDPIPLGSSYAQDHSWVAFLITFAYPDADVYPHFVRPDLSRVDGAPLGAGFSLAAWGRNGDSGMQLSRRSNRLNPAVDTAATKLLKVLKWLNEQ
jgi:hypothetical protein